MASNTLKEHIPHVQDMYKEYFLDYASYVITDRAVPHLNDGLKPVQRRILHALREEEDGRFHKVANIIGQTMKYHPHGDAAIGDALVNLGQKDLLIDTQGNWGDPVTGDSAAAPRYIEAKLSKFALEVAFNPATTAWQRSYDGRNLEPIILPMKFPLVLAQGAEGIAVGLATKIVPHNFQEILKCCIAVLKKEKYKLLPDFPTGGLVDASNYNDGQSGGKLKVRAKIVAVDNKTLAITQVPFGTTTTSLIESIVAANDKGKIKVRKIEDKTAKNVDIIVHLPQGADPDKAIDALYAFTDCESSISPNCCVIFENKPVFLGVSELLELSVQNTVKLLKKELEIRKHDLSEKWHFKSLEKIFIEERIYRNIEKCETWEAIIDTIDKGLRPFRKQFIRDVTVEDITRLTEIRIKRISRFDGFKADEEMIALQKDIDETDKHLKNLTKYAISYYERLLERYGKGRERKTRIARFDEIDASEVILSNLKVYVDKEGGYVGTSVRDGELVGNDFSAMDEIIAFKEDGTFAVTKVADKAFVGNKVIHVAKFNREDDKTVYNMLYRDGRVGPVLAKRFQVGGITRDKQYDLTKGGAQSRVWYLEVQPEGIPDKVVIHLQPQPRIKTEVPVNFEEFEVRARGTNGSIVTKYAVKKVERKTRLPEPEADEKKSGK
jgi:topoisomerase IV subunit A